MWSNLGPPVLTVEICVSWVSVQGLITIRPKLTKLDHIYRGTEFISQKDKVPFYWKTWKKKKKKKITTNPMLAERHTIPHKIWKQVTFFIICRRTDHKVIWLPLAGRSWGIGLCQWLPLSFCFSRVSSRSTAADAGSFHIHGLHAQNALYQKKKKKKEKEDKGSTPFPRKSQKWRRVLSVEEAGV